MTNPERPSLLPPSSAATTEESRRPTDSTNLSRRSPLCLATCFLTLNEENTRWWLSIQDTLARRGIDFILITSNPPTDERLHTLEVPLYLQGFGASYALADTTPILDPTVADVLAERDYLWVGKADTTPPSPLGVATCQHVLRTLLLKLNPAVVLAWGSSLGQSVLLQHLALQQGRPCWIIERGFFADTLMIELAGQAGQSELNWSFNLRNAFRRADESHLFDAAKEYFLTQRVTKYTQSEYLDRDEFQRKFNPRGSKIVALLLQHDAASCLIPEDYIGASIHAPIVSSSRHAISELSRVAEELNCRLIAKPHPNDPTDYSEFDNDFVCVARNLNLHGLIEAADVIATMTSTTQFEALLYEKPVLLLARTSLSRKDICYEPRSRADIADSLRQALSGTDFERRRGNARRMVGFVLQNHLIALKPTVPAGSSIDSFCDFLLDQAVAPAPALSLEERVQSVLETLFPADVCSAADDSNAIESNRSPLSGWIKLKSPGKRELHLYRASSRPEFERIFQAHLAKPLQAQQRLAPAKPEPFTLPGHCAICGCEKGFLTDFLYARPDDRGQLKPSWRERQICQCGLNSRQRACIHVLKDGLTLPADALVYCTEQQGPTFERICELFPLTVGSEYLGDAVPRGATNLRGFRNEDLTQLTFPDEAFDCVVSLEVLEHIPDYKAALREMARCLKPGGRLLLTNPVHFKESETVVRARFGPDGKLIHHLPPVYHGDPINAGGALCFNDFGWDLIDDMVKAGFSDAGIYFFSSEEHGYIGMDSVLLATRDAAPTPSPPRTNTTVAVPVGLEPDSGAATDLLLQRAASCWNAHNWKEASRMYQVLCTRLRDDITVWKRSMQCAAKQGFETLQAAIVSEALKHHPEWAAQLSQHAAPMNKTEELPRVSIIIPVLNKVAFTEKCLTAIKANTFGGRYEIIVWDNGSTDETRALLEKQAAADPAVRYFRSEENLGFVGGNNAAAKHARGEYLVLLNNDTEPQPEWLEALVDLADADSSIGAVGAKLVYPDGKLQEAGGIIFRDGSGWNYGRKLDPHDPRFNFVREVDYCSAACLLVRRALFEQLGGFDVRYSPAYYEDTDLCFELRRIGYRVVYQPRSEIIHHEGATAGQDVTKGFKQYQVANKEKFIAKWKDTLAQQMTPDAKHVRRASHRASGKRILVIDPVLPMHDRSSGSKRLFEMLKIFAGTGHAVTFIARNGDGGERYAQELQQLGIEVYAGDPDRMKECGFTTKAWPLDLKKLVEDSRYEIVLLSFWYIAEQYLPRLRAWAPNSQIIVDTVDVHFLRERRQAELYRDRKLLEQAAKTRVRELTIYRQADALVTVTEDDRTTLLKDLPTAEIFVVPNIHEIAEDVPPAEARRGFLFIGGFGHPPNEDAVLYFHREVWPRILEQAPDAHWTVVGNKPPASVQALAGPAITVTGYVPSTEPYLRSHLISIAPLRYGAGMKGKIGEALAAGLPVVTTTIGAEGMGLEHGKCGTLVANTPEEFATEALRLMNDRELWATLSRDGRQHIADHFTPACIARQLDRIFNWSSSFTSIIILALNQWAHTKRCLESIARHTVEPHEIILVDNGSTDETPQALQELASRNPRLRVISNRDNVGFAAGNNQGLSIARGSHFVLLNNDTVVTPGWLGRFLRAFEQHPDVGILGPMSNNVSGPQKVPEVDYTDDSTLAPFSEHWAATHDGQSSETNRAVGFCLVGRRAVLDRIGGLDERFGSGNFEDDDYCVRARMAGFGIRIAKDVFIHHTGSQTFKGAKIDYRQVMLRNWGLFCRKWDLPEEISLERGYPIPKKLPPGIALKVPLPDLSLTHRTIGSSRWSNWGTTAAGDGAPNGRSAVLPTVASVGTIAAAIEQHRNKDLCGAAKSVLAALARRPHHPEAYMLLAEISLAAGAASTAKRCAQQARQLAPHLKSAKKFLQRDLKGGSSPEWLHLPAAIQVPSTPRLSVCLIVRNEERFLDRCLASIKDLASQIVVVDTGSFDRTVDIARQHGAEIHTFAWCDDFAAARNAALEHATGDWVLVLDADEELPASSHDSLRKHLREPGVIAWRLPIVDAGREQDGRSFVPRLFRNAPGIHFVGRIHEHAFGSVEALRKDWGLDNRLGAATLLHHGYTKEVTIERGKVARNLQLLQLALEDSPGSPLLLMNLGLELCRSGRVPEGLQHYSAAFQTLSREAAASVVPELREMLLSQFASYLLAAKQPRDVVQVLTSPLARQSELTATQHYLLGMAHAEQRQFTDAAAHLRQCIAKRDQPGLTPASPEIRASGPRHALALCLWKSKDIAAAGHEFALAVKEAADAVPLHVDYARFLNEAGSVGDALQLLHQLSVTNPDAVAVWQCGGRIALGHPEIVDIAVEWTGVALQHHANHPELVALHAEALLLSGQISAALPLWESLSSQGKASALAAALVCEIIEQGTASRVSAGQSAAVAQEFLRWYWRLVEFKSEASVLRLLERVDVVAAVLPSAAQVLSNIIKELSQPAAT